MLSSGKSTIKGPISITGHSKNNDGLLQPQAGRKEARYNLNQIN